VCRYLVQDSVSVLVKGKWKKWEIIDKAIEQEGWKLLVLLRLSPIVPYNLLNITMAATKIHFWPFAIASFFGEPLWGSSLALPHPLFLPPATCFIEANSIRAGVVTSVISLHIRGLKWSS